MNWTPTSGVAEQESDKQQFCNTVGAHSRAPECRGRNVRLFINASLVYVGK